MVAKIPVAIDDQTKAGFDSIKQTAAATRKAFDFEKSKNDVADLLDELEDAANAIREAKEQAEGFGATIEDNAAAEAIANIRYEFKAAAQELADLQARANEEAAAAEKMAAENRALNAELGELRQRADSAGNEVGQLQHRMEDQAKAAKKAKEGNDEAFSDKLIARMAKAYAALWGLKELFNQSSAAIQALADNGSPAFDELRTATQELYRDLLAIGDDPDVQAWASGMAKSIKEDLIPALKGLPDNIRSFQDEAADFFAYWGEQIGVFAEGTLEALQDMQREEAKAIEQAKERIAEQRFELNFTERLAKLKSKMAEEEAAASVQASNDLEHINELIQEQTSLVEEIAKQANADAETREKAWAKLEALEKRKQAVIKQTAEMEKAIAEEAANHETNLRNERSLEQLRALQTEAERNAQALDNRLAEQESLSEADKEQQRKAADDVYRLKLELIKKEGEQKEAAARDELEALKARNQTARELQEAEFEHKRQMRQKEVDDLAATRAKELEIERAAIENRKALLSQDGKNVAQQLLAGQSKEVVRNRVVSNAGEEAKKAFDDQAANSGRLKEAANDPAAARRLEADRNRAVREAQKEAFRDFNAGKTSSEAINQAAQDNANAIIEQAQAQGGLNKTSAQALKEMTKEIASQADETQRLGQELEQLTKQFAVYSGNNQRTRSQRGGSR